MCLRRADDLGTGGSVSSFVFVGEQRSELAKTLGYTWSDGRLAGRQLFDALLACEIDPDCQHYTNYFENGGPYIVDYWRARGVIVVAMGQKVHAALEERGIKHLTIVHPAARGSIRLKKNYAAHVEDVLLGRSNDE